MGIIFLINGINVSFRVFTLKFMNYTVCSSDNSLCNRGQCLHLHFTGIMPTLPPRPTRPPRPTEGPRSTRKPRPTFPPEATTSFDFTTIDLIRETTLPIDAQTTQDQQTTMSDDAVTTERQQTTEEQSVTSAATSIAPTLVVETTSAETTPADPCSSNPCVTDANTDCISFGDSYACQCTAGYTRDANDTCVCKSNSCFHSKYNKIMIKY